MIEVRRIKRSGKGLFGKMYKDGEYLKIVTLENAAKSIKRGEYDCVLDRYNAGGYVAYEILVPGRKDVKIHKANWPEQLEGCIAPGMRYYIDPKGKMGISSSGKAFDKFMEIMGEKKGFKIKIS